MASKVTVLVPSRSSEEGRCVFDGSATGLDYELPTEEGAEAFEGIIEQVYSQMWRTDFDAPGFCLLDIGPGVDSMMVAAGETDETGAEKQRNFVATDAISGETDWAMMAPHAWKAEHPESVRLYRQDERRQAADRKRVRRARRRLTKP